MEMFAVVDHKLVAVVAVGNSWDQDEIAAAVDRIPGYSDYYIDFAHYFRIHMSSAAVDLTTVGHFHLRYCFPTSSIHLECSTDHFH